MSLQRLTISSLFTAIIAILAQLAVPVPFSPVPVTGQVIGVFLTGALLGRKAGTLAVFAYLLLGAAGVPVFSMGRGGLHMLTGPGGGYLWGFIPAVFLIGFLLENIEQPSYFRLFTVMLASLGLIYLCGTMQLALVMGYTTEQALLTGVIPFLPFDLLKITAAIFLTIRIKKSLARNNLGSRGTGVLLP